MESNVSNISTITGATTVATTTATNATTAATATTASIHSALSWDDATWILTSAFIIFTMQSGFGLLEAGSVSTKNEVNIMVKNAVDVIFGGISYWMFGFGVSFGDDPGSNSFSGWGHFLLDVDPTLEGDAGGVFAAYVFQLSFSTTATTIVSGAMAERTKLSSYIVFSFLNTIVYVFPAHWVWATNGFLRELGCIDIAGSGVVHMLGGVSALVAAFLLGPRLGRYDGQPPSMGCPANALVGMFMLWWGWLGFNCGSTFGISGDKWILASRSAVTTLNSSMAGGMVGILISMVQHKGIIDISYLVNSVLGGLVAITASCAICRPWEALVIGGVGGALAVGGKVGLDWIRIDDPVGAIALHGFAGLWGMVAVGLFVDIDYMEDMTYGRKGLFHGGGGYLLGIQLLSCLCIAAWSAICSLIILGALKLTLGIRMSEEEELLGADIVEHNVHKIDYDSPLPPLFARRRSTITHAGHHDARDVNGVRNFNDVRDLNDTRHNSPPNGVSDSKPREIVTSPTSLDAIRSRTTSRASRRGSLFRYPSVRGPQVEPWSPKTYNVTTEEITDIQNVSDIPTSSDVIVIQNVNSESNSH